MTDQKSPQEQLDERAPRRILDKVIPWIAAAYAKHAPYEAVEWEVGLATLPNPQGQMVCFISLYAHFPGAIMGSAITNASIIQPFALSEEHVDNTVREQISQMRQGRSQQLDQMKSQADQAVANGHHPPQGGPLILP